MRSILFDPAVRDATLARIEKIHPETQRQWGQMTVNQVLCHMADPLRIFLGHRHAQRAVPRLLQPLLRWFILTDKDWKHGVRTLPVFKQGEGGEGTQPTDFQSDKNTLIALVHEFSGKKADFVFAPSPGVGHLNREQLGFFVWKHFDHHLRQFGV